jgi:hypothetical protein
MKKDFFIERPVVLPGTQSPRQAGHGRHEGGDRGHYEKICHRPIVAPAAVTRQ